MNNDKIVSLSLLKSKVHSIDLEIKALQQDKAHLEYVIQMFSTAHSESNPHRVESMPLLDFNSPHVAPTIHEYDPSLPAGDLIADILKTEKRRMSWKEIFEVFQKVKPNVKQRVFLVTLSYVKKKSKYSISHSKKQGKYWYVNR